MSWLNRSGFIVHQIFVFACSKFVKKMKSVVFYLCKSVCLQFEKFTYMHGSELLIWFLPAAAANQIISCKIKWIYFGIYKAKMAVLLEIVKNATVYKVFKQQMVLTFFFQNRMEWNWHTIPNWRNLSQTQFYKSANDFKMTGCE